MDEDGFVDHVKYLKVRLHIPPVQYLLDLGMHWAMGIPEEGYRRVTTPPRPYNGSCCALANQGCATLANGPLTSIDIRVAHFLCH